MKRRDVLAGLGAVGAGSSLIGRASAAQGGAVYTYYAAVGARLVGYRLDANARDLVPTGFGAEVPEAVQSCWQHPATRVFYVASSGQSTGKGRHSLSAFRVTPQGALVQIGDHVPLAARPIFMTVDPSEGFVLSAYNSPAMVTAHHIQPDGAIGRQVEQTSPLQLGAYPHQIRMFPSPHSVLVPARGNDATPSKPEDPGTLNVLHFADGQFTNRQAIAPNGGLNFRPRHADFHPSGRWLYLDLESQNVVQTYAVRDGQLSPAALFTTSTLRDPAAVARGQLTSAIQVHPNGRTLYVANRGTGVETYRGESVSTGENTIAVFAINPATGEPTRKQSIEIEGVHARTFCLSPDGDWLVAAPVRPAKVRVGDRVEALAASLSLFSIAKDGALTFRRKVPIDIGAEQLFWVGAALHPPMTV